MIGFRLFRSQMPSLLLYALFPRVKQKELTSFTIKYLLCPVLALHILFFFYILVLKRYGTYNSTLCVINYYCPFGLPPLFDKTVGEPVFIISREVIFTTLKLF